MFIYIHIYIHEYIISIIPVHVPASRSCGALESIVLKLLSFSKGIPSTFPSKFGTPVWMRLLGKLDKDLPT